jgi:hypothetical protein
MLLNGFKKVSVTSSFTQDNEEEAKAVREGKGRHPWLFSVWRTKLEQITM